MTSQRFRFRTAAIAGGAAITVLGILTGTPAGAAPGDPSTEPTGPTGTASPSFAPSNPVDCTDPNNTINCQAPPIDSPLAPGGTAEPGSPFRD